MQPQIVTTQTPQGTAVLQLQGTQVSKNNFSNFCRWKIKTIISISYMHVNCALHDDVLIQFQQPQPQAGGIQLVQQVLGPSGEIQQIPIQLSASQLQMLRMQLQGTQVASVATSQPQAGTPIILQTMQTSPVQVQHGATTVMTTGQNNTTQIIQS